MKNIFDIPAEKLGVGSPIKFEIAEDEDALYRDIADQMYKTIEEGNRLGKNISFISPVGPIGQYAFLSEMVNRTRLSLKNVYIFSMDEYMLDSSTMISAQSPISFRLFMDEHFYSKVDDDLNVPKENRFFPEAGKEGLIWDKIQELGGLDMSIGGIGINGHMAFNEPPEPDDPITDEEFKNLKTRVLKLARETRTINAAMAFGGCIDLVPEWCITVGMKEILSAKKVRFYMNRFWQKGMVRKVLHGPVTRFVPASFMQEHPDARLMATALVAQLPAGKLV